MLVSDDASSDGTYDIVARIAEAYRGPHRLVHWRNPQTLGIENHNALVARAGGALIVMAHGDDVSRPDRVARLVEAWRASGASLLCSNAMNIDEEGREIGLYRKQAGAAPPTLEQLCRGGFAPQCVGSTLAFTPDLFARFGPLVRNFTAVSDDWILPFRACLLGGIALVDEPLVSNRIHPASLGARMLHQVGPTAARGELPCVKGDPSATCATACR